MMLRISPKYYKIIAFIVIGWLFINATTRMYNNHSEVEDIYYIFSDGKMLSEGVNPYARIIGSDMRVNDKYPTYFPLFYSFTAITCWLGLDDFEQWIVLWRTINLLIGLLILWLVLDRLYDKAGLVAGILGSLLVLLHCFSLYVYDVAQIDFLAILFLLWSLIDLDKKPTKSMFLLGISLSIKQIAVFVVPLYIIYEYMRSKNAWRALYIGLIPLIISIPFLIWDAQAYIQSILFSATRNSATHFYTFSYSEIHILKGVFSTFPMLVLMCMVYYLFYKGYIKIFLASFLIFNIFIGFNTVIFKQYMVWTLLLVPFLILEFRGVDDEEIAKT